MAAILASACRPHHLFGTTGNPAIDLLDESQNVYPSFKAKIPKEMPDLSPRERMINTPDAQVRRTSLEVPGLTMGGNG